MNDIHEIFKTGFQLHHSDETALVKVANYLLLVYNQICFCLLELLDLCAVFTTIDHNIGLNRQENVVGV